MMGRMMTLFTLVLLVALAYVDAGSQCETNNFANFRFSVTSRRNETGHRLVEVLIRHNVDQGSTLATHDVVNVDVEHGTAWRNGAYLLTTIAQASAPPVKYRPPDYELFPGLGYYKLHTTVANWNQANSNCTAEGAHLLVINSAKEYGVIKEFFSRKPKIENRTWAEWMYVGFSDRAVEGEYTTVLGESLSSSGYVKWHSGQPDNVPSLGEPDQDCGGVKTTAEGTLQDLPCSGKTPYICEQEL